MTVAGNAEVKGSRGHGLSIKTGESCVHGGEKYQEVFKTCEEPPSVRGPGRGISASVLEGGV